jgi:hypothetical protein
LTWSLPAPGRVPNRWLSRRVRRNPHVDGTPLPAVPPRAYPRRADNQPELEDKLDVYSHLSTWSGWHRTCEAKTGVHATWIAVHSLVPTLSAMPTELSTYAAVECCQLRRRPRTAMPYGIARSSLTAAAPLIVGTAATPRILGEVLLSFREHEPTPASWKPTA